MALSQIITECKRYGCMKNLLACYANCRYNTRCDDLRNELADKTEQAERDINEFLRERSQAPVMIKLLSRGIRFVPLSSIEKKATVRSMKSAKPRHKVSASKPRTEKRRKKAMPKKTATEIQPQTTHSADEQAIPRKKEKRKASAALRRTKGSPLAGNGKLYIVLEGESATLVDQQGLVQRMMSRPSSKTRFFEAHEVEARIQIVPKK